MEDFGLVLAVIVSLVAYVTVEYPPPETPHAMLAMQRSGNFFHHTARDGNTYRIFFTDVQGSGPSDKTLFLMHGFPVSSYDWHKVLPELAKDYGRLIVPDQLGYGLSDKPLPHHYTIMEEADFMEGLLGAAGVKSAHFFCHDTGLTVCLEMLTRFNSRQESGRPEEGVVIQSFAFQNGGMFPKIVTPQLIQNLAKLPILGDIIGFVTPRFIFYRSLSTSFGPDTKPDKEHLDMAFALVAHNNGRRALPKILDYLNQRVEFEDRWIGAMVETKIPVHYIYSPSDPVNREATYQHFLERVPSATTDRMPESIGHWGMLEDPENTMVFYRQFLARIKA